MSRESAIEAIRKTIERVVEHCFEQSRHDAVGSHDRKNYWMGAEKIFNDLRHLGFVHLDDVAEGWHWDFIKQNCPEDCEHEERCRLRSESFCFDKCYRPATIKDVLSGKTAPKEG